MSEIFAPPVNGYENAEYVRRQVACGEHRELIGGLWDEIGTLQADFLKSQGLLPEHALIDIGAGCFRAGVKLVPYLDPGNYYAIDLQAMLLEAGYAREIEPVGLAGRFPRSNFAATGIFDVSGFRRAFDFGIAQSVFTHMPLARLESCLSAIAPHFRAGGKFFVTVFLAPDEAADKPFTQLQDVVTAPDRDPFHTTLSALREVASRVASWQMLPIGDWGHPRAQQMVCFTRR